MVLNSSQKRGWLRSLIEIARLAGTPLRTYLLGLLVEKGPNVTAGEVAAGVTANGKSISYSTPGSGGLTQPGVVGDVSEFLDLYDEAEAGLIAGGTPTPTDAQIGAAMVDAIHGVTSFTVSHANLRRYP